MTTEPNINVHLALLRVWQRLIERAVSTYRKNPEVARELIDCARDIELEIKDEGGYLERGRNAIFRHLGL